MIVQAQTHPDLDAIRTLLREYAAGLGPDLPYSLEPEMAALPGRYAPPLGLLLLARGPDGAQGCIALRPLDLPGDTQGACEVKHLYVRATARGTGTGRALLTAALAFATAAGHRRALLDTLPTMAAAQSLYRAHGFTPVPPYHDDDPTPGLVYLGRTLSPATPGT